MGGAIRLNYRGRLVVGGAGEPHNYPTHQRGSVWFLHTRLHTHARTHTHTQALTLEWKAHRSKNPMVGVFIFCFQSRALLAQSKHAFKDAFNNNIIILRHPIMYKHTQTQTHTHTHKRALRKALSFSYHLALSGSLSRRALMCWLHISPLIWPTAEQESHTLTGRSEGLIHSLRPCYTFNHSFVVVVV